MAKKKRKKSRKSQSARPAAAAPPAEKKAEPKPVARRARASTRGKATPAVRKQPNALQRLIRETRGELKKVTWPTREEAMQLTKAVLIVTFAMSAFLGLLDWLFNQMFALFFNLFT